MHIQKRISNIIGLLIPFPNVRRKVKRAIMKYDISAYWQLFIFLHSKTKQESICLVEFNNCHGEVIAGFVQYFKKLGYNIDIIINSAVSDEKPFCRQDMHGIRIFKAHSTTMRAIINSQNMKKYKHIFLMSSAYYKTKPNKHQDYCTLLPYFKRANLKPYIIEHDLKNILLFSEENELKENRIITLGKFDKGIFINPHNFGEVKNLSKNEITTFVTVGKIEAKRKNFNKLIESLNTLIDKRQNFHVIIIGMGKIKTIPKRLRPYIKITGRLNFPKMYKNLESADFFLPLLDPDVKEHERYITTGVTGSAQLIYGFTKIPVIDQKFAGFYRFNDLNAIIYDHDLSSAMEQAINMTAEEYNEKQSKLTETVNLIAKESMDNLKRILNYENK